MEPLSRNSADISRTRHSNSFEHGIPVSEISKTTDAFHLLVAQNLQETGFSCGIFRCIGDGAFNVASDSHPFLKDHFRVVPGVFMMDLLMQTFSLSKDFLCDARLVFKAPLMAGATVRCVKSKDAFQIVDFVSGVVYMEMKSAANIKDTIDESNFDSSECYTLLSRDDLLRSLPHGDRFMLLDSSSVRDDASVLSTCQLGVNVSESQVSRSGGFLLHALAIEVSAQSALSGILHHLKWEGASVLFRDASVCFADDVSLSYGARLVMLSVLKRSRRIGDSKFVQCRTRVYSVVDDESQNNFGERTLLLDASLSCHLEPNRTD
jgi:hypothetical protein